MGLKVRPPSNEMAASGLAVVKMIFPARAPLGSGGWLVLLEKTVLVSKKMRLPPHDCLLPFALTRAAFPSVCVRLTAGPEGMKGPCGFAFGTFAGPSSSSGRPRIGEG